MRRFIPVPSTALPISVDLRKYAADLDAEIIVIAPPSEEMVLKVGSDKAEFLLDCAFSALKQYAKQIGLTGDQVADVWSLGVLAWCRGERMEG